jgi:hypothetical protein
MAKFTKGTGGRPKGAKNKASKALRDRLNVFLADKWGQINEVFKELTARERIVIFTKLMVYSVPKINLTEIKEDDVNDVIIDFREQSISQSNPTNNK